MTSLPSAHASHLASTPPLRQTGEDFQPEDFTEAHYGELLDCLSQHYRCISYRSLLVNSQGASEEPLTPVSLWRHDVDFSPHRALKLAQLEAERGIQGTYFFLLHSEFYNVLEISVSQRVKEILALGHELGLHFDPTYYGRFEGDLSQLAEKLRFEKQILETCFEVPVHAFSFHNPETANVLRFDEDVIAGMVNTYGKTLKANYKYCSDSNGYWRFERLWDVLNDQQHPRLQILTHPEWWVPEPMPPRARVERCVQGRAVATMAHYDGFLEKDGRLNVR